MQAGEGPQSSLPALALLVASQAWAALPACLQLCGVLLLLAPARLPRFIPPPTPACLGAARWHAAPMPCWSMPLASTPPSSY